VGGELGWIKVDNIYGPPVGGGETILLGNIWKNLGRGFLQDGGGGGGGTPVGIGGGMRKTGGGDSSI